LTLSNSYLSVSPLPARLDPQRHQPTETRRHRPTSRPTSLNSQAADPRLRPTAVAASLDLYTYVSLRFTTPSASYIFNFNFNDKSSSSTSGTETE
ncbi:hypothetical protein SO802_031686, partial [Lithocarpus litseifolius]